MDKRQQDQAWRTLQGYLARRQRTPLVWHKRPPIVLPAAYKADPIQLYESKTIHVLLVGVTKRESGKPPNTKLLKHVMDGILGRYGQHTIFVLSHCSRNINTAVKETLSCKSFEIFLTQELQYNIFDNIWVPEYKKLYLQDPDLSDTDRRVLSGELHSDICLDDPVCRYLGLRVGDVVRERTPSVVGAVITTYRRVVSTTIK